MTASPADAIATLRIEVKYIEPSIWRRVAVRTSMNLMALHKVIQAAMGWLDYHLWEFAVDERKYGIPDPDRRHVKNGATTQLATILASGMTEFDYVYDFGDNWEHRIVVEQIGKAETGAKYPQFLGGERCCHHIKAVDLECVDDDAAKKRAEQMADVSNVELWEHARRIAKFDSKSE